MNFNPKELQAYTRPLFVYALEKEVGARVKMRDYVACGIGKVNATLALAKALMHYQPDVIINLGSAGSNQFRQGELVCCTQFYQRDMDLTGLGYQPYETPFIKNGLLLDYGIGIENLPQGVCGTGDSFEMTLAKKPFSVVDMEAYALARVAQSHHLPFVCIKYISDGADDNAATDWEEQVHLAAAAFDNFLWN